MVNATKELTGHCLAGSGVIEAVATAIQLREGFHLPRLRRCTEDVLDETDAVIRIPTHKIVKRINRGGL